MKKHYYIYILTNYLNTTFYIGVTDNLLRRIIEHKSGKNEGFSSKYNLCKLVYYEETDYIENALNREKQLKNWHRDWKINLITENNKGFRDLSEDIGFTNKLIDSETSSE